MDEKEKDPFAWRTGGKRFEIGETDEGGIYDMIPVGGDLLCVTRKSIHSIRLADSIDPKRTNPALPDMQQKVLPYGADTPFVGRTLLQAKVLFEENALDKKINCSKAISIALSFLKEIVSLHETSKSYINEENEKNKSFEGKTGNDDSLHLPSIDHLEQRVKQFVINSDHASRHLMEITQLFYPEIKSKNWSGQLKDMWLSDESATSDGKKFAESMSRWMWLMRNLRNAIEHPKQDDQVVVRDYWLEENGKVTPPLISYESLVTPLANMKVSQFTTDSIENLLTCFEILTAYLCNLHAKPFAGDIRSVAEIPLDERTTNREHVRFSYHIAWTK